MITMNKQYPSNIKTFDKTPNVSKFFKIVKDEDFVIFKSFIQYFINIKIVINYTLLFEKNYIYIKRYLYN